MFYVKSRTIRTYQANNHAKPLGREREPETATDPTGAQSIMLFVLISPGGTHRTTNNHRLADCLRTGCGGQQSIDSGVDFSEPVFGRTLTVVVPTLVAHSTPTVCLSDWISSKSSSVVCIRLTISHNQRPRYRSFPFLRKFRSSSRWSFALHDDDTVIANQLSHSVLELFRSNFYGLVAG